VKMTSNFAVVEFTAEYHVAAVHSSWLFSDNTQCKRPSAIGKNLANLVRSGATPKGDWKVYECRVLRSYGKLFSIYS
jgi:hypothetical protein